MNTERAHSRSTIGRWVKLAVGLLILWVFVFQIAPRLQRLAPLRRFYEHVRASDIDAGALYYTDVEEFAAAETHVRNSLRYPTAGK